jgi:hypothetical protein
MVMPVHLEDLKLSQQVRLNSAANSFFAKLDARSNTLSNISIYFHIRKTFRESVSFNNIRKTAKPDTTAI